MEPSWVVDGSLALALRISRVCGAAPIRLAARGGAAYVRPSRPLALYGIAITGILTVILFSGVLKVIVDIARDPQRMVRSGSTAGLLLWLQSIVSWLLLVNSGAWLAHARFARLRQTFGCICKLTAGVQRTSTRRLRERRRMLFSMLALAGLLALMGYSFFEHHRLASDTHMDLSVVYLFNSFYITVFIGEVMVLQVVSLIFALQETLEIVNDDIERLLTGFNDTRPPTRAEEVGLRRAGDVYESVSAAVAQLCSRAGAALLLPLLSNTLHLISSLYDFVDRVALGSSASIWSLWCLVQVSSIAVLIEPCHQTQQQLTKLRVALSKLLYCARAPGSPPSLVLHALYRQTMLDAPTFTPLGVCTLSRSMFTTLMSTLITFFVIIMQYRMN